MTHLETLNFSCDKAILFIGLACQDIVISVDSYPSEDELVLIPSPHSQRGGDASSSCVVYSLLQNKYKNIHPFDMKQVYFMGTLPKQSKFVVNDLQKYKNINIDLCHYDENNNTPISYIFISSKTGSRTIAHHPLKYPLTYKQFLFQLKNENINLSEKFNLIFFDFKWLKEMTKMIEYIYNNYKDKIIIATELETADFFDHPKNIDINHIITQIILWSDIIFFSQQYLEEKGFKDDTNPIKFLQEIIEKYLFQLNVKKDKMFIVPWGSKGCYCVQLSNYKNILFCKAHLPPNNKVIDTLGAGDTFNGSLLFGLRKGWSLKKSCDFANAVAAYKVGFHGFDCIKHFTYKPNSKL